MTAPNAPPSPALARWLNRIHRLDPARIELGLSRVNAVLPRLELPGDAITITVAGTNGKGTSVYWLDHLLRVQGYRVGRFVSPHLSRFNERIAVGGEPIDDDLLVAAFERVADAQEDTPLTYFEFTTLAALVVFHAAGVEAQVLEVGLGGRLDAVNAVLPDACLLTSVAFDHQRWLGDTLDDIGREKAGIFRASVPAVIATPEVPSSVLQVAEQVGADTWLAGRDFLRVANGYQGRDRQIALPAGEDGVANSLLAAVVAVLESLGLLGRLQAADLAAITDVRAPGRLETFPGAPPTLLDVAHNPHAIERLARRLAARPSAGGDTLVFGAMRDKPIDEMLALLRPVIARWVAVASDSPRAASVTELASRMAAVTGVPALMGGTPGGGWRAGRALTPRDGRVVVAGSFPVVGAVRCRL